MQRPLEDLIALLDLEEIEKNPLLEIGNSDNHADRGTGNDSDSPNCRCCLDQLVCSLH